MPIEAQSQLFPNLHELKEQFKKKLDQILYKKPTVENIGTFADEALDDLTVLNEDILVQYITNPSFEHIKKDPIASEQEKEDDAYKKLELPNLQEILQGIGDVRSRIEDLKNYIKNRKEFTGEVITPPVADGPEIMAGSGNGFRKELIPRLLTLLYLLETDLAVKKEDVRLSEGEVRENMVRQTPYLRIDIPDLKRTVYICDEEGNASYVFDSEKLEDLGLVLDEIDIDDKREKNTIIAKNPGVGIRIIQSKNWRKNVSEALSDNIPETPIVPDDLVDIKTSEFFQKKEFLTFEDFQTEVRTAYPPEESDVQEWYRSARRSRVNWPANPPRQYQETGWKGWSQLVGKEIRWKKDFLTFEDFRTEVNVAYPGEGNAEGWYKNEYKKHPKWPSTPAKTYGKSGWIDWAELVGRENRLKKEYLPFSDFQAEVRALYFGESAIQAWYYKEIANHSNWPSLPYYQYEDDGWLGWPELVGKENRFKIEYPSFTDFQIEVRAAYKGEGNIEEWYQSERKNHRGWHTQPYFYYKDKGWEGFPELVGRENRLKTDRLTFEDFQTEVRAAYPGSGDVQHWYKIEKIKHKNWPAGPWQFYSDDGWIGWSELVGKENPLKKDWPSFENFQAEVRGLYPGIGGAKDWYTKERKNHSNWPSQPREIYKDEGWIGWPELVGK